MTEDISKTEHTHVNKTEEYLDYFEDRIKEDREATFFVFLTALSRDTNDPQNIFLRGDSGIGKTWVPVNVLNLFDGDNIWMLGGLSPTALIHSYGELVDANGDPIDWTEKPTMESVKHEMMMSDLSKATDFYSKARIQKEYFKKLKKWNDKLKDSKYVVDLRGKLLVFLDPPRIKTFNMLRPVLSHDKEEISYRFTDKSGKGQLRTQHVVLRGWPACIFCTTDKTWMEDLATRSLTMTPKTTKTKLRAACILIGEDAAYPVNDYRKQREAKMKLRLQCLQSEIEDGKFDVAVPYAPQIGEIIPLNQPRIMRDFKHIVAFIKLNALLNHKHRARMIFGEKTVVLANYKDFITVMEKFEYVEETTITGLRKSIINLFHKAMVPLGGFTYSELVDKCREVLDRPLSESTLRDYVKALSNVGYVSEEKHPEDKRMKIIRVIKKTEEKLSEYIRTQFSRCFTLDSFKTWVNNQDKYSVEKPIIHNNNPNSQHHNDIESIFNQHYVERELTSVKTPKKDRIFLSAENTDFREISVKKPQKYKTTEKPIIPLTPVMDAERCPQCGNSPVAFQFTHRGQKIKRCRNCIKEMENKGLKFTTLKEV